MIGLFMLAAMQALPAEIETGNSLYRHCRGEPSNSAICFGYIGGIYDALTSTNQLMACVPPGVEVGQLIEIVDNAIREHPATREGPAAILAKEAWEHAYPCHR